MKIYPRLWFVLSIAYMIMMSIISLMSGLQVWQISGGYIPLIPLALLFIVSGVWALFSALSIFLRKRWTMFVYGLFSLSWSAAAVVMDSTIVSLCSTEIEMAFALAGTVFLPTTLGFFLVWKATFEVGSGRSPVK
jgi:hypothetical protein